MSLAELLSPFEAMTVATAVAIIGQWWRMAAARKADQRDREARIVERTREAAAIEHRLAALEKGHGVQERESTTILRRLDQIQQALTVVETTGKVVVDRLARLEGRRNGGPTPGA